MGRWAVSRSLSIAGSLLLGVGGLSCSLAFDLDREQCEQAADCSDVGFAATCENKVCVAISEGGGGGGTGTGGAGGSPPVDPLWGCLGTFQSPVTSPDQMIPYHYRVEGVLDPGVPPVGLTVKLCALLDFGCASPLPLDPPDADGNVFFTLRADFEAFLEIEGTDLMPTRAHLPVPPVVIPPKEKIIRAVTNPEFQQLVDASGQNYDPMRGIAVMLTVDCNDDRAAGVQLTTEDADATTVDYYFKNQIPIFNATQTDDQGAGGWVNLPTGLVSGRATLASSLRSIGSASFNSRPGTISYVPIGPTPGAQ